MKLRQRISLYIIAVMGITLALLTMTIISDLLRDKAQTKKSREQIAIKMLKRTIEKRSETYYEHTPNMVTGVPISSLDDTAAMMIQEGLIDAVAIKRNGELVVFRPDTRPSLKYDVVESISVIEPLNTYSADTGRHVSVPRRYEIYVYTTPIGLGTGTRALLSVLAIMLIGTVILVWVILLLLGRLVIRPIERLASSTDLITRTRRFHPVSIGNPGSPELSALVDSFNAMIREIDEFRQNLEQRVADETAARLKAQQGLIAEQRLAATGRLAAGVAHEINNPLGGLINAARSMKQRMQHIDDERVHDYIDLIQDGLDRIRGTVSELLEFSRPTGITEDIPVYKVFETAGRLAEKQLRDGGIDFTIDIPDDLPMIRGSVNQFSQIALNLILNAIAAVEKTDQPAITVQAKSIFEHEKPAVRVTVTDNGCGIPDDMRDKIFDIFFTLREQDGGTGLGLALVQHLVALMNGTIRVESRPGHGASFIMTFPVADESNE